MKNKIPTYVADIINKLKKNNFEGFVVGGCVRDMLLGKEPKDWDVATNAKPEEVLKIFPFGKYENVFGTVVLPQKYLIDLPIISKNILISDETTERLIEIAKKYVSKIECRAHRLQHSENVARNAVEIAKEYKDINLNFIRLLAYFHDTGRTKYDDVKHINASKEIFRKEAKGILDDNVIEKIVEAMEHNHEDKSRSLEQHILKEADIIDGIDPERIKIVKEIDLKIHINWIKNRFNPAYLYKEFITLKGKESMRKAVDAFNKSHTDLMIPEFAEENNNNVEITTYRIESKYTDKRHPDNVRFAKTLEEDLSRRDFTINALALDIGENKGDKLNVVDLFGGQEDLKKKIIRAVGKAEDRFNEDALRMMRAIRFAVQLNFKIEKKTFEAIKKNAKNLEYISAERIKDEFEKIIISPNPAEGVKLLYKSGLLFQFIPEFSESVDFEQGFHHYHGPYRMVFDHLVATLKHCPSKKLEVRLACLFHDIGKPKTAGGKGIKTTFYNHQYAGEKMTREILKRMRFSRETIEKTTLLVRNHMFFYDVDQVGEAGVRRVIRRVGLENINDLIDVRIGDRLGSGVAKAVPYKLRHFKYMVEKVSKDPISVKQLKINGNDLMDGLKLQPGPKIGAILDVLLAKVIEKPELNEQNKLLDIAKDLINQDLSSLRQMAREKIVEEQEGEDKKIKGKYWIK